MIKYLKRFLLISFGLVLFGGIFILWSNYKIEQDTQNQTTDNINKLPNEKVGLVLGTSKMLKGNRKNLYFLYRIDATEQLYKSGKIQYIIVSGDNSRKDYNEPEDMKLELIKRGIPQERIYEDFAGFRTLDSVVRAKEIFGQNSYIIISQKFHNERACFLAQQFGIKATGYNAKDVPDNVGLKTKIREYFARAKVFYDLLVGVEPKFGGQSIKIGE